MRLVLLAPGTRLNTLTFKRFTTLGTHNFTHGLLVLLQLLLHLLALILKEKKAGPSTLTIIICSLALHFLLFIEIQVNEFTPVKVDKNANSVKKDFLINPNILLHYVILFH